MTDQHPTTPPTHGGTPVTDDQIAQYVAEAEHGYDVDTLRRRGGRRPMGTAAADVVPVRLDPELRAALTRRAQADHTTTSDVIRQALRAWLNVA
jgi:Ribbon-helix-helix protein, copG family